MIAPKETVGLFTLGFALCFFHWRAGRDGASTRFLIWSRHDQQSSGSALIHRILP